MEDKQKCETCSGTVYKQLTNRSIHNNYGGVEDLLSKSICNHKLQMETENIEPTGDNWLVTTEIVKTRKERGAENVPRTHQIWTRTTDGSKK